MDATYRFFLIVIAVLVLVAAALGIDCISREGQYSTEAQKEANKGYLIACLSMAILVILFGLYDFFLSGPRRF